MARNKNIKIQMHNKINEKIAIGKSRHEEKANSDNRQSDYIHSYNTADSYRQTVDEFSAWLKENKSDIWNSKNLESIDKDTAYEYLRSREDKGCSPHTVSKDMSAINKTLGLGLEKKEGGLKNRSNKNITRSRNRCKHDSEYNYKNYKEQIEFAKSFGLRRESICGGAYQVKEKSLFKSLEDGKIYCRVIEKGGKYREAPCLASREAYIEENYKNIGYSTPMSKDEFRELYNSSGEVLFDKYTKKIDNHAFRREYAQELYKELNEEQKKDYRGYDEKTIKKVSEALGHSRLDVVIDHYLK